jgi:hypothetical protein
MMMMMKMKVTHCNQEHTVVHCSVVYRGVLH